MILLSLLSVMTMFSFVSASTCFQESANIRSQTGQDGKKELCGDVLLVQKEQ